MYTNKNSNWKFKNECKDYCGILKHNKERWTKFFATNQTIGYVKMISLA